MATRFPAERRENMMKRNLLFCALSALVFLAAIPAIAQDSGTVAPEEMAASHSLGLIDVALSSGILGLLNWAGIFLWAVATMPLGILSIVHCATLQTRQWPLATKLLACGGVWVFVLGWTGLAQGSIWAFTTMATASSDTAMLALSIGQAFYSLSGALAVCQFYLLFFVVSIVIAHFKHRKLLKDS